MRVPPRRKTRAASMIVFLLPIFSAIGNVKRAPKKQPALMKKVSRHDAREVQETKTDLECGDNVALDSISLRFRDTVHAKITNK